MTPALATRAAAVPPADTPFGFTDSAVLARPCDGYPAGTTGVVVDVRQGCAVVLPHPDAPVARWARRRRTLHVPLRLLITG